MRSVLSFYYQIKALNVCPVSGPFIIYFMKYTVQHMVSELDDPSL